MKAEPNTIVENLAICSNCGRGLHWVENFRMWVHQTTEDRQCSRKNSPEN